MRQKLKYANNIDLERENKCTPINLMSPPASQLEDSIALLWDKPKNARNVESYYVYVNNQYYDSSDCTDYTVCGLKPSSEYELYVCAKLSDGTLSPKSNIIIISTKPLKRIYDITEYGAIGDGTTLNTEAIQNAIDACEAGGKVYIPKGIFLSGAIFLKSDITLHIEEGGVLLGSTNAGDYRIRTYRFEGREIPCYSSLINTKDEQGKRLEHITISGKGTINASGVALRNSQI